MILLAIWKSRYLVASLMASTKDSFGATSLTNSSASCWFVADRARSICSLNLLYMLSAIRSIGCSVLEGVSP